jgi:hypothetical protein
MFGTRSTTIALLSLAAVAACGGDDNTTGLSSFATVRVANATSNPIDVASGSIVATGNANIAFGTSSSCVTTDVFAPDVSIFPSGTINSFPSFTPVLRAGQVDVIVDFPSFLGAPQFATINTTTLPPVGQAGLQVFNAMSDSTRYDVYISAPTAPLGTPVALGIGYTMVSGLIAVTPGTPVNISLTYAGTQAVAAVLQSQTFTAGLNSVLVVAAPPVLPTPGPRALPRTFLVTGC